MNALETIEANLKAAREKSNIKKLFDSCGPLTAEQQHAVVNYLVGYLAQNIPADTWSEALGFAVRCAKLSTGEKI